MTPGFFRWTNSISRGNYFMPLFAFSKPLLWNKHYPKFPGTKTKQTNIPPPKKKNHASPSTGDWKWPSTSGEVQMRQIRAHNSPGIMETKGARRSVSPLGGWAGCEFWVCCLNSWAPWEMYVTLAPQELHLQNASEKIIMCSRWACWIWVLLGYLKSKTFKTDSSLCR